MRTIYGDFKFEKIQFPDNMPQLYPNNNQAKRGSARLPKLFVVELQVGEKIYTSEGRTRQQAKHEAALAGIVFLSTFLDFPVLSRIRKN